MPYNMINTLPSSGLVSNPQTVCKGIKLLSQHDKSEKNYHCFSISFLYQDLFQKVDKKQPIITIPDIPKNHFGMLIFLLPPKMLDIIKTRENIKISGKNNDCAGFFYFSADNNKIRDVLFELLSDMGWKAFIEEIRLHIIENLKSVELSGNNILKDYLNQVGNQTIVPYSVSSEANIRFKELLSKGDNESLLLIIANFFVSCLIGIRSMHYEKIKNKYPSIKTYLLSEYGMECIWKPDIITPPHESLDEARQMYKCGRYSSANKLGKKWLTEYGKTASDKDLAIAYQIIGSSLCNLSSTDSSKYKNSRSEGIAYLEKCVKTGKSESSVFYFLYDHLKESSIKNAAKYLKTAFAQNYAKAVIEVAFSHLNSKCIFYDITEDLLLEKINCIIENEQGNDAVDVGICLYLRGRFAKIQGNNSKANEDFELASKRGNESARQEISRKKRIERHSLPTFINDSDAPCCYTNTLDGNNSTVISTFPCGTWMMYTSGSTRRNDINTISDIEEFVELQCKFSFSHSKLVFLLMSGDEEKNLNECLILLDKLFNIVLDKPPEIKWQIIDSIDIFVSAKYETASMLIDANISDMGKDIYFKVHITDENRDTVHKLLCEAPLFLPMLKGDKSTKVVLFGGSEMNYSFIKESIACAYLGSKKRVNAPLIEIALIGENADILEKRFRQECPGIHSNSPSISCIRPQFIKCSVKDADFPGYIYGSTHQQLLDDEGKAADPFTAKMVNVLLDANYFVVDHANDLENIRFAAELRTWLLRSRGTFDRAPFIGVKCSNEQNSYLANHLTLAGQASGSSYFNKYDLFPIGISAQTYSYRNIIDNPVLNNFALRIHRSYYGDNDRMADNDFYSYSYNADSSLSTAIGLCYRFFAAGVVFNDKDNYLNYGFFNTPNIESKFEEIYKERLEYLASLEQSRWNGFMLSRGWESANVSQVEAYKEQSTGSSHKHTLAKLHPFIKEWEDLDDPQLERVLGILKSRFNYDRRPQSTTIISIEDTAKFFKAIEKENERMR